MYNLEDALVVAQWLNVFLRKCDVLKIACLAQIVNIIAPMLTTTDSLLKQSTFYPLQFVSTHAAGAALDVLAQSPVHASKKYGDVPLLDVSASFDAATGKHAVFVVNRSRTQAVPAEVVWQAAAPDRISTVYRLAGSDPKAANSFEQPDVLAPATLPGMAVVDKKVTLTLPPLSFTGLVGASARR